MLKRTLGPFNDAFHSNLSCYLKDTAYRRTHRRAPADVCFTCRLSNAIMHNRVLVCVTRARKPVTISELLPEIMPVKTELEYAVSTGIGERRCYAEACIQTHLLWLIEEGKVQRMKKEERQNLLCRECRIRLNEANNHGRNEMSKRLKSEVFSRLLREVSDRRTNECA